MGTLPPEQLRHLAREKALFRYYCALERGDFETVESVLAEAENDATLERLILELNEALEDDYRQKPQLDQARSETVLHALAADTQDDSSPSGRPSSLRSLPSAPTNMRSSLDVPDSPTWCDEPGYSPAVASALVTAFTHLRRGHDLVNFNRAYNCLQPVMHARMAVHQRLSMFYVFSITYAATGDYAQALHWLDEALNAAVQLATPGNLALLLFLRGGINRSISQLGAGAADYRDCLALIHEQEDQKDAVDPAFEVEVLSQLAGFEFYLAQFETAEQRLQQARTLASLVPKHGIEAATIEWIQSLLFRLRGQPELALRPAVAAAEVYLDRGSPISAARIQTVLAHIGLDLAERLPDGTDRGAFITLAQPHVQQAIELAYGVKDETGTALACLAHARYSRLSAHNEHRIATIEQIIQIGVRLRDEALLAQGWTALGDELNAQGETEQALYSYRTALSELEGSDIPAAGVEARRALLRAGEMGTLDYTAPGG
ncbi:MAG: hypothetical protein PVSMB4_05600 [Ktedonobacterales bacterium]